MLRARVRPFLRRFLVSYLTILIIPVLLNISIYRSSANVVKGYVEDANLAIISQAGYALDQRISSLSSLVSRSSVDTEFDALSKQTAPLHPTFHIDLNLAVKDLRPTFILEGIITDFFVYMTNSGYLFDSSTITSSNLFFKYSFEYGTWGQSEWMEFLRSRYHRCSVLPAAPVRWGTEAYVAVPLIWSVPFYLNTTNDTFIVFLVSEQDIFNYFKPLTDEWEGTLSIYDANDRLIISSAPRGDGAATDLENTITVSVPSTVYDFRYELTVPSDQVYEHLIFIRRIMLFVTFLAMAVGGLAAVWFSAVNSRPLRSMASLLSADLRPVSSGAKRGRSNPFDVLNTSVREIISSNESMQARLSDQKLIINEEFFYRLLKEGFETRQEMRAMKRYLDVPELAGMHGVALLNFLLEQEIVNEQTVEEMKGLKILLLDSIRLESRYPKSWVDIGENSIAFLLTTSGGNRRQWEEKMEAELGRISAKIGRAVQFDIFWTIGNPVSDFFNLHSSHQQARELSRLLPKENRTGMHWYRDFVSNRADYYLPMELLQRIYNLCMAGDYEAVCDLFVENWQENMSSRKLSPVVTQQYLLDYRGLIMRLDHTSVDSTFTSEFERDDLEIIRNLILGRFQQICERVKHERQTRNERFKDEITQYLLEHFHDVSLSLHSVASHFNISEGYLSHFFKKASGSNFYTFVESLRLEHAMTSLRDTRDTIKEIAYNVGYSSVQSFRRAFKRVYGISPSSYREI
jgi:two-component system, response regulator YesN